MGSKQEPNRGGASLEPGVKGVAFRTIDDCFVELCGVPARDKANLLMAPVVSEAYRYGTLLSASWYPISWYREVLRAFRAATNAGPDLPRRIGALAVRHDMQGVHKRFVAWLVSPQSMLALSQRLFSTYYDTGRLEPIESRPGFVRVRAFDCVGWDSNMWSELVGSSGALLEECGAKHVRVHGVRGGRDGDAVTSSKLTGHRSRRTRPHPGHPPNSPPKPRATLDAGGFWMDRCPESSDVIEKGWSAGHEGTLQGTAVDIGFRGVARLRRVARLR